VTAVYYEGAGRFTLGDGELIQPGPGEVRLDVVFCGVCGTDLHIAQGHMDHRVRVPQVIGHEMSGTVAELGAGVEGFAVGDNVVVRPLDARGETAADKGVSHICRDLKFLGIDTPGAFQSSWTVPAFTLHRLPAAVGLRQAALVEPLAVACHDVRRGEVAAGESVVVIGGGPIGLLIGLVARERGALITVSEVSPFRRQLATELGLDVVDPTAADLTAGILERTGAAGADVVFEVSGSAAGADVMTQLACIRGRIVVVAIYPDPQPVRLFDFFWKELRMVGARVYEPVDYEEAISLLAADTLPLDRLVTAVEPLERLPSVFAGLDGDPQAMKTLIDCRR
jgi:(R,R)-butanediol dehydrogenase / meso-butanediol dehydrogenase / diacetyl reductase